MAAIEAELAALETMSSAELKALWQRLTRSPRPRVSPRMLRLALAREI